MDELQVFALTGALATLPPAVALRRLGRGERPFLLDGATPADGLGRYSYAGCDPTARLYIAAVPELTAPRAAGDSYLVGPALVRAPAAAVLQQIQQAVQGWSPQIAVGLLSYELGRAIEVLGAQAAPDGLGTAAVDLAAYEAVYRYDAESKSADILATDADAAQRLRRRLLVEEPALPPLPATTLRSLTSETEYARRVAAVLDSLRAGDCYQVNLCRWLRGPLPTAAALAAYLRLRDSAPAPLGFYLQLTAPPGTAGRGPVLLSNTPERLLRYDLRAGLLETRPIKGTRPRAATPPRDAELLAELLASTKDRAEHLMIVDLLRNDLGRIARVGSVQVQGLMRGVSLPTVHHLVSTVQAVPAAGIGLAQVLHALLPGGSITGAPKVRAMQIIDELEPQRRGPFYGAVGWLTATAGELALNIRTAVAQADELTLAVGGGIVLGSQPHDEWLETEAKAAAFARVLTS
jgi:para-aminobenzoate synthetase component 1